MTNINKPELNQLISSLKKYDKEKIADLTIRFLIDKKITYKDYLFIIGELGFEKPYDIEKEILSVEKNIIIRKRLSIREIKNMNFIEVRHYINSMLNRGLNIKDFKRELFKLWSDGLINGFDYRFVIEAIEEEVDICFLKKADKYGRYTY